MDPEKEFRHIVIGGMQRSGTSLVRALVGSHPKISIFQWDIPLWTKFSNIYADKKLSREKRKHLIEDIVTHPKAENAEIKFRPENFSKLIQTPREALRKPFFSSFYKRFLLRYAQIFDAELPGVKTPGNEFYTERIFRKFPRTKFIHVIRNPLDVAVSLENARSKWWGGRVNFNSHIALWKRSARLALRNSKKYKENYHILRYEDLIKNPEPVAKKICEFVELPFDKSMLEMRGHPGWRGSNSSFDKADQDFAFNKSSINRYREKLSKKVQQRYFHFLSSELPVFDYNTMNTHPPPVPSQLKFQIDKLRTDVYLFAERQVQRSRIYKFIKNNLKINDPSSH